MKAVTELRKTHFNQSCTLNIDKFSSIQFVPDRIYKKLTSHFARSSFHLRLAFLPGWLIQGCSSVSNPFIGVKIHRIFPFIRFTHSYGYASAGDHPNCFASFSLNSNPFMQYAG
jgi:hypothetical protein